MVNTRSFTKEKIFHRRNFLTLNIDENYKTIIIQCYVCGL